MHIAKKTLEAIEREIHKDQGARWRGLLRGCMAELEDAYRDQEESFRSHMGASILGGECARAIWYSHHWATKPTFTGRMQRLFNRGHMEEGRFVAMLRLIGVDVRQFDENGKQYRISGSHGHYGGSGDGLGTNVPDLPPGEWAVLEFKTHGENSYKELIKKGVRAAKPEHWAQMQQYMRKMGVRYSLYMGVNKNNDEIHAEIVELNPESADQFINRADKIVWLRKAPSKIGNPPSAGNFACKWCDHRPVCHTGQAPAVNCRTCVHAKTIEGDGTGQWACELHGNRVIPKDFQQLGCAQWDKHPDMGR